MATDLATLPPQHDIIVSTPRLMLRPVVAGDLGSMHAMRRDPAVMEFMPGVETEPVAEKSRSLERLRMMMRPGMFSFTVDSFPALDNDIEDEEGEVVGFVGITSPGQVFYIFDRAVWGRGYATEALRAFLEAYWERFPDGLRLGGKEGAQAGGKVTGDVDGDVLEAHVHEGNIGSEKVLERCGFVVVGEGTAASHGREVMTRIFQVRRPR